MPTITINTPFEYIQYLTESACGDVTEMSTGYEYDTRVYNDKDSRVFPSKPAFLHPTLMPKQSTTVIKPGLTKRGPNFAGTDYCYGPEWGLHASYLTEYRVSSAPALPTFPETDWPLDLRLKIKDAKVNLGVSLVEYRQSTKMFGNFAKGLSDAYRLMRGKKSRYAKRRLSPCDIPAAHLVASYGIEPLVNDLMDSIEVLSGRLEKPIYQRFVSQSTAKVERDGWKLTSSERAVVYLESRVTDSSFTLGNISELAWEVVPFSFVVDWGIGVGDYLSSLDALEGLDFKAGTLTTKRTAEGSHMRNTYPGFTAATPTKTSYDDHTRTIITGVPYPTKPKIGFSGSWRRLQNATALLWAVNERCK